MSIGSFFIALLQKGSQLEFKIGILLREIARNIAQLFSNCAQLCGIARIYAELRGVYNARNCAQVKSTCVGNPSHKWYPSNL